MATNWWISFVRTLVAPFLIGLLTQHFVALGFDDVGFILRSSVVVVTAGIYYYVARLLQQRWPLLGCLLVVAAEPRYVGESNAFEDAEVDETDRLLISVQRTAMPLGVGWGAALFEDHVLGFAPSIGLTVLVVATALFYGVLRYVEERSRAGTKQRTVAGFLLGSPTIPHY